MSAGADATEVELQQRRHIATIRFGDPARKNVLTPSILARLQEALAAAVAAEARVIVLRGHGDLWSAGYDVGRIPSEIFSDDEDVVAAHPFEQCMRALEGCPVVTVAALRGAAFGGALELAISCDLRLSAADCRFGLPPARLGIIYSHTGLKKLVRLVGPAHARMLLFAAPTLDAAEAERIGLVNRTVAAEELDAVVDTTARHISEGAPLAIGGMKQLLQMMDQHETLTEDERQTIRQLRQAAFESADFAEGRLAFEQKRPPRFEGR